MTDDFLTSINDDFLVALFFLGLLADTGLMADIGLDWILISSTFSLTLGCYSIPLNLSL